MKTIVASLLLILSCSFYAHSQEKVNPKDLIGTWKLVIEVDEAIKDAENDEDMEGALSRIILSSVSGLVENLLDEIDIYLEFQKDGNLEVRVNAFNEEEIEYSHWEIDKKGRLYIDETDSFNSDNYWMIQDGVLIIINEDEDAEYVYMVKLD